MYQKFNINCLRNCTFIFECKQLLKIINNIISTQYGIRIIKANSSKKNVKYYLSSKKKWNNLPRTDKDTGYVISRNIIDIKKAKDLDSINKLENGLDIFIDSDDSDYDSDDDFEVELSLK